MSRLTLFSASYPDAYFLPRAEIDITGGIASSLYCAARNPEAHLDTFPLRTSRLLLRELVHDDADFIFELLHDPSWERFIGNKSVHSREGAIAYIDRARAMHAARGHGLWHVSRREDGVPVGLCGLLKRDELGDVDLGFGFLTRYQGQGYGHEASVACLDYARRVLALERVVGVTSPDNAASSALLEKLGFVLEREFDWKPGERAKLYALAY